MKNITAILAILSFAFMLSACTPDQDFTAGREGMKHYYNQLQSMPDPSVSPKNLTNEINLLNQYVQSEKQTLSSMGQVIQSLPKLTMDQKTQYSQEFTSADEAAMLVELGIVLGHLIQVRIICATQYVDACSNLPEMITAHDDQSLNLATNYQTILNSLVD